MAYTKNSLISRHHLSTDFPYPKAVVRVYNTINTVWAKKRGDQKSTQDRPTSPEPPAFLANDQSLTETF
ncbi:hypothetical protein FVEG_09670 [Fusarium verticillioides 7600]|uniref:Uncharacterized protein n=1 Tax=Gibberella moniliformis (strain M3125 / FGSC 7600) TaxID=334819 RepID=W7MS50_GIBM7|nr:hypothetical protein FVEG_09670 [Fusarium verticillioides 7600]EWG50460.1 hypothetical protein FVEG_09670 [Fusarium verticillioides 7600]